MFLKQFQKFKDISSSFLNYLKHISNNKYLYILILIFFVVYSMVYLYVFAVNIIRPDELILVYYVLDEKFPFFNFLYTHMQQHYMYFPLLIYTILAKFTHLNSISVMIFSMILLDIIFILYLINFYLKNKYKVNIFLPLIIGLIIFNPRKFETFLTALGITYIMVLVFSLISFFIFQEYCNSKTKTYLSNIKYLILMIINTLIAFFSSGQGMTTPVTIALIWLLHKRKSAFKNLFFYIWIFFTVILVLLFLKGTPINESNSLLANIIPNPIEAIHYFFLFIGNITFNSIFGLLIFILSSLIFLDFIKTNKANNIFPILLILNNLLIAISTTAKRVDLGFLQAESSRYVTFGVMIILGCILYIYQNNKLYIFKFNINLKNKYFNITYILIIIVIFANFFIGLYQSKKYNRYLNLLTYYYQTYKSQPKVNIEKLYVFHTVENIFYDIVDKIEINKLNIFYDTIDINKYSNNFIKKYINNYEKYIQINDIDVIKSLNEVYINISGTILPDTILNNIDKTYILFKTSKFLSYNPVKYKLSKRFFNIGNNKFIRDIPINLLPKGIYKLKIQFISMHDSINYELNTNIIIINYKDNFIIFNYLF
jgi:hypothetical protein